MTRDGYRLYLNSPLWASIRRRALDRDAGSCRVCGRRATQVHHRSYDDATMLGDSIDSLVSLCARHHLEIEFTPEGDKRKLWEANKCLKGMVPSHRWNVQEFPEQIVEKVMRPRGPVSRNALKRERKARLRLLRCASVATGEGDVAITGEMLKAGRCGGLSLKQCQLLGIEYPTPKGWKAKVIGRVITKETYRLFLSLKDEGPAARARAKKQARREKRDQWVSSTGAGTVSVVAGTVSVVSSDGSPLYSGTLGVGSVVLRWDAAEPA